MIFDLHEKVKYLFVVIFSIVIFRYLKKKLKLFSAGQLLASVLYLCFLFRLFFEIGDFKKSLVSGLSFEQPQLYVGLQMDQHRALGEAH